ncbi:Protein FAR1-related sequence 5 [Vitis vinifera]|uniref:Protein FAR1-related sequence 5 n=1 Tax=Vitis vinifera TaxID=29760 RepID=A0A438FFL2_VITVI|nr:Protein FAR1-related sequence 5 [Vitis vinifera]
MTLSNSVYLQIMQSVKEKTIKREFEVKEEDVINDNVFIGATYNLGGNGLKQKVLKGISDEEVYKLQFDRIDEAETFYNMLARVAGFSIRKDDLKNGFFIFYKFNIDEESRLANLFWADSTARMDYACFGDVLAFDTTYRTNAYKKPLIVLVGVNHHHQTVVFGCALLIDESIRTYEWVLETFLDAMMNKKPISVVTDGDKAMRKAIKKVLPDTCHRLCSWHLQRNAFTNVHIKDFSSIFARCMFMRGNEEEFEKVWHEMVANLGLNENRWVTEIYGKRKRWAEAYLRGNFFGGMRTTQRAILRIRQNEAKAEFESNNSSPVLSTKLAILENHAATVYTKESFLKFREEMKNAELFFVVGVVSDHSMRAYTLSKFRRPNLNWEVQFCPDIVTLKCSYMMFESIGIPCCHMVVVMKVEHLEEIPQSCIMKRWTKLAKVYTRSIPVNETNNNMDRFVRYGSLSSMCNKLSYFVSDTSSSFIEAKNEIQNLTARMEELYNYNLKGKKIASDGAIGTNQVRDPNIVKTKGNPGKVAMNVQKGRRCGCCKRVGHTIRKCPEATIPQNAQPGYMEETNLSSQCDIQREMMPSTNSSIDIFATLHVWNVKGAVANDPSDMYIDWVELNNWLPDEDFPQPVEKIPQPVEKIPQPWLPVEKTSQPAKEIPHPVATGQKWLNQLLNRLCQVGRPVLEVIDRLMLVKNIRNRLSKFLNRLMPIFTRLPLVKKP